MRRRLALLALLAVALVTTACGAGGGSAAPGTSSSAASTAPSPTATPTPTPTPTTSTATPFALVASVAAITLVDTTGAEMQSAPFADGSAVLALVSSATGSTPAGSRSDRYLTTTYDWGGLSLLVSDGGGALVNISATQVAGLELRADGGLAVGSPSAAALAQGASVDPSDPSRLRFEITEAPGTTSLENGGTGVDFVAFLLENDTITRILAPADDYSDV